MAFQFIIGVVCAEIFPRHLIWIQDVAVWLHAGANGFDEIIRSPGLQVAAGREIGCIECSRLAAVYRQIIERRDSRGSL